MHICIQIMDYNTGLKTKYFSLEPKCKACQCSDATYIGHNTCIYILHIFLYILYKNFSLVNSIVQYYMVVEAWSGERYTTDPVS